MLLSGETNIRRRKQNKKLQGNCTHDYDICSRNKGRNIKKQTNVGSKLDESTKKIVGKTKIDRIRSQQTRESCGIQPINEWLERRRKKIMGRTCNKNEC